MRILLEEISADPNNQRTRFLLRDLWQDTLRKREAALEQGLEVSGELGASTDTKKQLIQALEALRSVRGKGQTQGQTSDAANIDARMFPELVRGAADSFEQGRQQEAFLVLSAALSLYPAYNGTGALPLSSNSPGNSPQDGLSRDIHPVQISAKTPAQPVIAAAVPSQLVTAADEESARQSFRAGIRFYSAGKLAQAAQSFREGLARDPGNEWIEKSLARTMKELELKADTAPSVPAPQPPASEPTRYLAQRGDTLWNLAQRFYGNPRKWEVIRDANPGLKDDYALAAGATLVIPPLPKTSPRH